MSGLIKQNSISFWCFSTYLGQTRPLILFHPWKWNLKGNWSLVRINNQSEKCERCSLSPHFITVYTKIKSPDPGIQENDPNPPSCYWAAAAAAERSTVRSKPLERFTENGLDFITYRTLIQHFTQLMIIKHWHRSTVQHKSEIHQTEI